MLKTLSACAVGLLLFAMEANAGSITGNLKLPNPYTQSGTLQIWVRANSTTTVDSSQTLLTITEGQALPSALISFSLANLNNDEEYLLNYSCQPTTHPEPCENIVARAYYKATNQSVFRKAEAEALLGSVDHTGIELPVMVGNTIGGVLNMPQGEVAPIGGFNYQLTAYTGTGTLETLGVTGFVNEGEALDEYQIMIPNDASETWRVGYDCFSFRNPNGYCDEILPRGYFNSSATNSTVENLANAEALLGGQKSVDIDMTVLTGFTVSGTLSVPMAPTDANGIDVTMRARDANDPTNTGSKLINIAQGSNSSPYEILIPRDDTAEWLIRYDCESHSTPVECDKYIDSGYFDGDVPGSMTTTNVLTADKLAGGQSHTGINFSMITGFAINGRLKLSEGIAPEGGINFLIKAKNTSGGGATIIDTVEIEEYRSFANYQVNIDDDVSKTWRVSFDCQEHISPICLSIADQGYFDADSGNTVTVPEEANSLAGGMGHSNIDLVVESEALRVDELCIPIKTGSGAIAVVCL